MIWNGPGRLWTTPLSPGPFHCKRGSPAAWVTSHEVNSSGAQGTAPAWWDPTAEPAYVTYVTDTATHIAGEAGYGGSILNYGELDSQLNDGNGKAGGWAGAGVTEVA